MRLFLSICLVMVLFASNTLLTRAGVVAGGDPMTFAALRVAAGAATLCALVLWRDGWPETFRPSGYWGATTLFIYLVGFSWANLTLDAGIGAIILFGTVQLALFGSVLWRGDAVPTMRWAGMIVAFAGLIWLVWPTQTVRLDLMGVALMVTGGLGWAGHTLIGQKSSTPLRASAVNFGLAAIALAPFLFWIADMPPHVMLLAVASGALASGLGYALWYAVLPQIDTTTAGVAQLSVPVIAAVGGLLFLSEAPTWANVAAGCLVLAGIGLSQIRR
ncbi:DMT family transporter [Nereida sp. MMG025]|uniref:DMT family transporter n=1 Tax=Nereida sp. MMG025 TaxID=2909981 RepID=UPI001F2CC524|nr:DMT family transporter [Nereida sp. MMG025]MCF6444093.1 DMT family transporter [Nereida sp. MMG025]